jgi:peptidoglycan L-alanyl-D-glutamate endopeptidase CwlK
MPSEILNGLHPELVTRIEKVLSVMSLVGCPMRVCQGVRTSEEQQKLFAQGRTAPGKIVTNADGLIHKSNHQAQADGFGHAVDCCFVGSDPFGEAHPWRLYGEAGKALGLKWGGDWASPVDRPHLEML